MNDLCPRKQNCHKPKKIEIVWQLVGNALRTFGEPAQDSHALAGQRSSLLWFQSTNAAPEGFFVILSEAK